MIELRRNKRRKSYDTEQDAWAGYKPKFIKSPVTHIWKYNKQPDVVDVKAGLKKKKSHKLKLKNDESKPEIVRMLTLLKGRSNW